MRLSIGGEAQTSETSESGVIGMFAIKEGIQSFPIQNRGRKTINNVYSHKDGMITEEFGQMRLKKQGSSKL